MQYDHKRIEPKWQKFWQERSLFQAELDPLKSKYYVLDMFPYPSGSGLHVGHVTGYTATDILARYKRQKGFNVLHPMGWDSFGLPAEQYAIRTGTHPAITTEVNINTYRRQLQALGLSYDWNREIATSDPRYYKWTQWIFTKLYEKGLAFEADMLVNYCPELGTVLANEEVEDGRSKEGGYPVERRPLRQWMLRITAYADRLLEDLDLLDWPESLKRTQANWIGRSEGARIDFVVEKSGQQVSVFTTRSDTLFGATYLVIAPEHPLVTEITTPDQQEAVDAYRAYSAARSDLDRTDLNKDKTGVFSGGYALHPVTGERIPIWIADYVLIHYGTGAVMGVPAHDERDFNFATKFSLPIVTVIVPDEATDGECWTGDGTLVKSGFLNGLTSCAAKKKMIAWLEEHHKGEGKVQYKLRDWLFSRQRYWGEPFPILHFEDGTKRVLDLMELPLCPPELVDFKPSATGESPLAKVKNWVEVIDQKTGRLVFRETNTMPQWAGSCWYYLRFCDPHNTEAAWSPEKEKYWLPVDLYVGGVEHAVLHLLYARFWHKVLYDCGLVSTKEPFQTLKNQGLVVARSYKLPGGGYVSPEEVREEEGRYVQIGTDIELISNIDKMGKSKLNGVSPDEMIEEFGADALRLYEMFMGPFEKEKLWNTDAVSGCRRFLNRFYDLIHSDKVTEEESLEALRLIHRLIAGVERDIEAMQFNTAIAKMMEFMNDFIPLQKYPRSVLKILTQLLMPFAPHLAEEAWERFGDDRLLSFVPFPQFDPLYLIDATVTYVVQVNGKLRGRWELPKDQDEKDLLAFIQGQPQIVKHITGNISKVIYVPNKLINIVLESV